jgi:flagellar protein FliO/FliZ
MGGNANLRVVGSLNLGGRERLLVVEVGNQWIVVGARPAASTRWPPCRNRKAPNGWPVLRWLTPHAQPTASFADWLKQTIDKRK